MCCLPKEELEIAWDNTPSFGSWKKGGFAYILGNICTYSRRYGNIEYFTDEL